VHSQFHSISSSKKMEKIRLEKSHKGKRHIFFLVLYEIYFITFED
jgi:hypothetical protein